MNKDVRLGILILFLFSTINPMLSKIYDGCLIPLEENWQIETWKDTQGITKIEYDSLNKVLVVSADLKGKHPNLSKGELFLDLHWASISCLDSLRNDKNKDFMNLSGKTLYIKIQIPKGFIGSRSAPNGIQLFAKSGDDFNAAYSAWENIEKSGEATFKLNFKDGPFGFKKPKYDCSYIASIGVKIAINSASRFEFKGDFKVKEVKIK